VSSPDPAEAALRAAGLRVTAPRRAVLNWLADHPHATADAVGAAVRARLGSVSTQAVYDVLAACVDAGLVRRIQPAGHPARYERRVADNHHHVVCRRCGATAGHRLRGRARALPPAVGRPGLRRRRGRGRLLGALPALPGPEPPDPELHRAHHHEEEHA
jgi:Fur family ferric uptake transcriptional regulator